MYGASSHSTKKSCVTCVQQVFINTRALAVLHSKISLAIQDRQSLNPVVEHIADVYLKFV